MWYAEVKIAGKVITWLFRIDNPAQVADCITQTGHHAVEVEWVRLEPFHRHDYEPVGGSPGV